MNDAEELLHDLDMLLKESNFTKAAQQLYISQPYLTQLIKRIEKKVGAKIINRDTKPFSLTEAGLIYYKYLENVSYNDQQLERKLAQFSHPEKEVIKIGILESLGSYLLPEILPTFLNKHPNAEIQLFEAFPRKTERRLLNEEIDCYIGQTPEAISRGFDVYTNGGEQYYIVIPANSKYFQTDKFILAEDELDIKELLEQPLVLSQPESAIRHQINGLFQKYNVTPKIVMESNSVITVANLAVKGIGLTISSASILKRLQHLPINLLPINRNLLMIKYFIAIKQDKDYSPAITDLVKIFRDAKLEQSIH
ncbi:LysR family transcriptional regulator [Lactobacillus rodentium]|uniref:LysR family transcriptional regulator n=1 Tax=Lactobacillus rodentium TaxID=947835 RepID=A0A2Z6T7B6_9LACO|nr:LysR family transcriptional regulator [Lactobacillus rodentium]MCR1894225.1 LysR family transcriptional regulator [Lactobacillus rodentium]GBG04521.1 LysR family transcriptional regulator [Lactobacillus rodentium]